MRTAVFSTALILGGLLRRFGAVLFGIGAIREKAQRGLVQLRRDAIGRKPDLQIINDGAVECRLSARLPKSIQYGDTVHWTDKLAELGKQCGHPKLQILRQRFL